MNANKKTAGSHLTSPAFSHINNTDNDDDDEILIMS